MFRACVFLAILATAIQTPTVTSAQQCAGDTTFADTSGECSGEGCASGEYNGGCRCGGCARGGCECGECGGCCGILGGDIWTRDRLFGNVFGAESLLAKHGIVTDFKLGQYYQNVTTGGNDQTGAYGGKLDMYYTFLGESFGFNKGFNVIMHAETRFGQDIGAAAGPLTLANAPMLWPLPGNYHGTNITGLMATQQILDGKVGLLAGKLNTLDLVQGIIPEIGFGRESFLNVNALTTALPWFRFINLSEWGTGFWTYDKEAGGQIQHGLIVFGLNNVSTDWDFGPSFDGGVGMLGWLRFFYEVGDKPGWVACFVGGATRGYNSLDPSDWIDLPVVGPIDPVQKQPWDVAPYVSQVLWHDRCNKARKINLVVGGTIADDNPSFSNWNVFSKLEGYGLRRSRPGDRMGIAGWYNGISDDFKDLAFLAAGANVGDNWGMEMYYNREVTKWCHWTSDMQILQNSNADTDTSLVLGTRLIIDL